MSSTKDGDNNGMNHIHELNDSINEEIDNIDNDKTESFIEGRL